eukprot:2428834-Amphidinium_carterae.1
MARECDLKEWWHDRTSMPSHAATMDSAVERFRQTSTEHPARQRAVTNKCTDNSVIIAPLSSSFYCMVPLHIIQVEQNTKAER